MSTPMNKRIAVVIPVYNESKNIAPMLARLAAVAEGMPEIAWTFIWVNDGSSDNSWLELTEMVLQNLYAQHANIRLQAIDLSRNFGKELALTAGLHHSDADAVICIDADLQHPPEVIPELVRNWRAGNEIVATVRSKIEKQPLLRRIGSHAFYWLMSKISGIGMRSQTTDFRLYDKKVVDVFRQVTEKQRMLRGIMDWLGFKKVYVEFTAAARESGEPGYSYGKLWQLAVNSITSFSLFPLKLTGYLGGLITLFSGLLFAAMVTARFVFNSQMFSPLAIVVVANTFLIGIVLMAIGMVALYIGHIHTEVINRPLYVVRDKKETANLAPVAINEPTKF